ncbi:MAG TPA: PaaX family transcriptional regulator C-terminal domain-containing protein [Chthoniobacterales bacterium]|nr:PaaX family transcriptional regulator C-terminal domain-containing protein [Chthoniobacterales bacterium]
MAATPASHSKISTVPLWIRRTLAADPPRAKSLVVTLFGDAIAPHGGCVQLKGLIELLGPFGINERLVRTSVFRLVKEGWLEAKRNGRESSYELTQSGRRRFSYAYARVYARVQEPWKGDWTLVLVRPEELSAERRQQLRQELEWQGLRQLAPQLYAHPRIQPGPLAELLERTGARKQVISFGNATSDQISCGDFQGLINERWNLVVVAKHYQRFLRNFGRMKDLLRSSPGLLPQQWFSIRILMIHAFRRAVLHDPLLPEELLPKPWIGNEAYQLAQELYRLSLRGSEELLASRCGFAKGKGSAGRSILRERFL